MRISVYARRMKPKKTPDWRAKFECEKPLQIKTIGKPFAGIPAGASMLIVTPRMVDHFIRTIPRGRTVQQSDVRAAIAKQHGADYACPVTTGIALRVVAELAYTEFVEQKKPADIAPFWRALDPESPLAAKLACGKKFILQKRAEEQV
jgi:hypothetical protein